MRVFVTGASGEIGRPALRRLLTDGHDVRCAVRSPASARIVAELGGSPVEVDLFDGPGLREAVGDAEAILHLATAIPPSAQMGDLSTWVTNDRLRVETTQHLADAARQNGAEVLQMQSYFGVRAPAPPGEWIDDDPEREPPWSGIGVMDSMRAAEETTRGLADHGVRGVVLRFGSLYSPTSEQLQAQVRFLREGLAGIPGPGDNAWPFVTSDDAAAAVVAGIPLASGSYNVGDDEPATMEEFWTMAARTLDLPTPPHSEVGGPMADVLLGSWRVSNRAFVEATDWRPSYPSVLEGWPEAARIYLTEQPGLRPD